MNSENVLLQMETVIGRSKPGLLGRPVAVFSGSPQIPGSLINSVDSIFGRNPTGKPAIQVEIPSPLVALGSLAICYQDSRAIKGLVQSVIVSAEKERRFVPENYMEWFLDTLEKLKGEFY
jgi:hypothetical protein